MDNIKKIENVVRSLEVSNAKAVENYKDAEELDDLELLLPVHVDRASGTVLVVSIYMDGHTPSIAHAHFTWDGEADDALYVEAVNLRPQDQINPSIATTTFEEGGLYSMEPDSAEDLLRDVQPLAFAALSRIMLVERAMSMPIDTLLEAYAEQVGQA